MFNDCIILKSTSILIKEKFKTSKAINMEYYMFNNSKSLSSFNVLLFNSTSVKIWKIYPKILNY